MVYFNHSLTIIYFYIQLILLNWTWLMPNKQETMSRPGLAVQKISDLEERVHYLEDQNLSVRKALETALNQNKYLEDRLEKFGKKHNFWLFFIISKSKVCDWGKLKTKPRWGNHLKKRSWSCWNSTRTLRRGSQC